MAEGDSYEKTLSQLAGQQMNRLTGAQTKEQFKQTMRGFQQSFEQQSVEDLGYAYDPAESNKSQIRVNNNYMPPIYSLSDNFLQQTFLADANSFVHYQRLIGGAPIPPEFEVPLQIKTHVKPNPNLEFKPEDNPQAFFRFKSPYSMNQSNGLGQQAIFDNDASLFQRNVLSLTDNTASPHLKTYIDMLGGIEDTVATMENSLKSSELKNLEEKYVNFYVPNYPPPAPLPVEVPPPANPFARRPCEGNSNIDLIRVQAQNFKESQNISQENSVYFGGNNNNNSQEEWQKQKPTINPILEQSRRLRQEREKGLMRMK